MKDAKIYYSISSKPKAQYMSQVPSFAWLNPTSEIDCFSQKTNWHSCRESFISDFRQVEIKDKLKVLDLRKLRVAILFKIHNLFRDTKDSTAVEKAVERHNAWMFRSVRMLNVIEQYLGWSFTKLYKDSSDAGDPRKTLSNVYVLVASPKWIRSPQLISMFLLFVRLGIAKDLGKVKSIEDLVKNLSELSKSNLNKLDSLIGDDLDYGIELSKYLKPILDNVKKIFFARTIFGNYVEQGHRHGINGLVRQHPSIGGDDFVKKRFSRLVCGKRSSS